MPQFKDVAIEGTAYLWVATNDTNGSGANLDSGNLNFDVRLAGALASDAPIYSGTGSPLSHVNYPPGSHELAIPCTAANGFAAGNEYAVFATGLVDAKNPNGFAGSIKVVASGDTLHSAAARVMDTTDADSVLLDATQISAIQSGLATAAKLLDYVQLLARSDAAITTDNAVALGEINTNEGSGAGDFSNQTEAVEALRDRGDLAWDTATGFAVAGDQMDLVNAPNGTAVTAIQNGLATSANQTTILNRIGDFAGTGLNTVKGFLQALFRSDAGVTGANTPSEINEVENTVTGDYDGATESNEALRDRGDAAWVTGTGTSTLTAQDVADALKLAPTAGAPATGSVNKDLDTLTTGVNVTTIEGLDATDQINAAVDTALFSTETPGDMTAASIGERVKTMDDAYTATRAAYLDELAAANIPADVDAILNDTGTSGVKVAADAIADAQLSADTDVYEAKVTLFVDAGNATPADRYAVGFFKNGSPVTSGVTVPLLTVYQMNAAATVLVNAKTLLQASTTGLYYYDTTTELATAGLGYQSLVTATIDGSSRTMTQPVGRDTSA